MHWITTAFLVYMRAREHACMSACIQNNIYRSILHICFLSPHTLHTRANTCIYAHSHASNTHACTYTPCFMHSIAYACTLHHTGKQTCPLTLLHLLFLGGWRWGGRREGWGRCRWSWRPGRSIVSSSLTIASSFVLTFAFALPPPPSPRLPYLLPYLLPAIPLALSSFLLLFLAGNGLEQGIGTLQLCLLCCVARPLCI